MKRAPVNGIASSVSDLVPVEVIRFAPAGQFATFVRGRGRSGISLRPILIPIQVQIPGFGRETLIAPLHTAYPPKCYRTASSCRL